MNIMKSIADRRIVGKFNRIGRTCLLHRRQSLQANQTGYGTL